MGGGGSGRVLRLAKVGRDGQAYYLEVAEGTGTGIEPAGRWQGRGAGDLGLDGPVAAEPLAEVLAGRQPGGAALNPVHGRVRVAAFDLTFCAPKSVSLLHALGDPDVSAEVRQGHDEAVAAVLGYVERRAAAVRGPRSDRRIPQPVRGLVAAGFVHRVSRALDPHLHTHLVVANLASGPDGHWHALDGRGLFAHRTAADALYHAHLRDALSRRLGVAWEPARNGRADIAGIDVTVRRAFSQRAEAIAAELHDARERCSSDGRGPSRRAADVAAARTRQRRDPTVGASELGTWWRDRARAEGLGPSTLERVIGRGPRSARRAPDPTAVATALSAAPARRHVVAAWCRGAPDGARVSTVEREVDDLVAAAARRAGVPLAPDRPGVAEPRVALGVDRAAERTSAGAVDRYDRDRHAAALLAERLAARGMGDDRTRSPMHRDLPGTGRRVPVDLGPDLGLG